MKIWVVIPAYNEEDNLAGLLQNVKGKGLSVLAVDDGSIDNTYVVARKWADVALHNIKNLGKGISLRRAISYLFQENHFDYVITMDGDGQHSPEDLTYFIQEGKSSEAVIIIGNRMDQPRRMPIVRVMTNRFMSWLISKLTKQKIPDTQCGFRLIKRDLLEKIRFTTYRFETESEILIQASRLGYKIESIPIKSIYRKEKSRINPLFDTVRFINFIWRQIWTM